jgi:precorrin-3B C17-methyltransferase
MDKQGKLLIIGFGPGALEHITGRALAAIEESEAVIGYNTYVELIKPLLRHQEIVGTGMTEEVSRAQEAVRRAEIGQTIAVISSGDAGVYGMAGLVYEVLIERGWDREKGVQVEVIPGISAIQSCSSLLGAPIMHDACTISLSDHLTPWDSIAARVEAAAKADFVIAFYNPRSGRRTQQIEEARSILLRYRDPGTPVGIVKSAYRDRQQTVVTTLQDMLEHEIGMLSTVIVGNSATNVYEGLMITPRGYERKYNLGAETQVLKPHERLRTAAEPWSLAAAAGTAEAPQAAVPCASATAGRGRAERPALAGAAVGGIFRAELEIVPPVDSRALTGVQMALLADAAGEDGELLHTRDGRFLLRSTDGSPEELAAKLLEAGLPVMQPGSFVTVKACDFCEGRREGGLGAARRLHSQLSGQPVPRELSIRVNGCGMACSSAVLEDIGLVYSKGSFELYLGGKKSGRGAHAGTLVRDGMNEDEAVAAVTAVVEAYQELGTDNERFHAFFARMGPSCTGLGSASEEKAVKGEKSMKTVLLVGHGSRVAEGNDELRAFADSLARRRPELKFQTCFIELAGPSIAKGIENCVNGGATEIYVVPIILFAAGHSKLDIPMAIDQAKAKYPGVEFIYGRPLGVQDKALEILLDRITTAVPIVHSDQTGQLKPLGQPNQPEKQGELGHLSQPNQPNQPNQPSQPNYLGLLNLPDQLREQDSIASISKEEVPVEDTVVLLMGRGGSDPDANSDFYKLSRLLWERTSYKSVESCFIAIAKPSLPEGLERCLLLGARKIIAVPYLLFTGVLIRQFNERVAAFAADHPEIEVEIGSYLGPHPLLADMLLERIDETLSGRSFANCDNCKYRSEAGAHHHHHHDHAHGDHEEHGESHGHHGHDHRHDHHHDHTLAHCHRHDHNHAHCHHHEHAHDHIHAGERQDLHEQGYDYHHDHCDHHEHGHEQIHRHPGENDHVGTQGSNCSCNSGQGCGSAKEKSIPEHSERQPDSNTIASGSAGR